METSGVQIRSIDNQVLPPVGKWTIDTTHSAVQFVVRHMAISKVRGKFDVFEGTILVAETPDQCRVEAVIRADSISTGDLTRDEHLRSPDFLDAEHYPKLRYRGLGAVPAGNGRWEVLGELTIRDVTRPVSLDMEFAGISIDPWGKVRSGFTATTIINREDFDVRWNQTLETGGFLVSKEVRVELEIEAVLANEN